METTLRFELRDTAFAAPRLNHLAMSSMEHQTGLEPVTSCMASRHSSRLNYWCKCMVQTVRLELTTSSLSERLSNQLAYVWIISIQLVYLVWVALSVSVYVQFNMYEVIYIPLTNRIFNIKNTQILLSVPYHISHIITSLALLNLYHVKVM